MRRKFKRYKKVKIKKYLIFILILFTFVLFKDFIQNISLNSSKSSLINTIFNSGSFNANYNNPLIKFYNYVTSSFNDPKKMLSMELSYDYSKNNNIKSKSVNLNYAENNNPLVYIYNSHQGETYSYKYLEEYNIVPDVIMAAKILKDKLEEVGISTVVEEENILNYMKAHGLNHAGSYKASRVFLERAIKNFSTVKLYIDLHRDAASHKTTYININGLECAKILFVIGLEYDTYEKNLSVVTNINNKINEKYPGLSRGILKKQGAGVNGIYNQDLNSNVILLEVGGNESNIEEITNTLELIAPIIGEYINEKK